MIPLIVFCSAIYAIFVFFTFMFLNDHKDLLKYKDGTNAGIAVLWPFFLVKTLIILMGYGIYFLGSALIVLISDWRLNV